MWRVFSFSEEVRTYNGIVAISILVEAFLILFFCLFWKRKLKHPVKTKEFSFSIKFISNLKWSLACTAMRLLFFPESGFQRSTIRTATFHFSRFVIETPKGADPKEVVTQRRKQLTLLKWCPPLLEIPLRSLFFCRHTLFALICLDEQLKVPFILDRI